MTKMTKHFVTFYSPGTLVAETTEKPIESWDVETARRMAKDIKERYGAVPYGFQFSTRERDWDELDSHETVRSPMYYLGGKIETLAEVKARATDKDRILVSNMECNHYDRVITTTKGWHWTQPLRPEDVVLEDEA